MLVLSRKIGERIQLGENVTVFVTGIKGNRVLIGVRAPKEVKIVRGELKPHAKDGAEEAKQMTPPGNGEWRQDPFWHLGMLPPVNKAFEDMKVTTIGGLVELRDAIDNSQAVWPKKVGAATQKEILKRLEDYIDKHREKEAAAR